MPFSPKQQYCGQTVFLTGGLGYLGSVILEQLLRLTEVKRVYLLVRGKRQHTAPKRVESLLCSPLFHLLHKEAAAGKRNAFSKVTAVEGDLTRPSLSLSEPDLIKLQQEVGIILHCGANIELDADIQMTFRNNYLGTMELMRVASEFDQLRAFVHVSTYFVNNHLPRNSVIKEQIYPLPLTINGTVMSHSEYVAAMLSMEPDQANKQTADLMQSLNFTSTYAFGKHLTEQLVDGTVIRAGVSRAIVRPSLIASIAGDPYPGYINSYAGAGGYTMGYALGFFQGIRAVAYASDTLLDLIPADIAGALVISAGAAAAATYGSPSADLTAVIFHAASADSAPLTITRSFAGMAKFWKANPPPLCLPATSYVKFKTEHNPTSEGIEAGAKTARMKIKLVGGLLKLAGKQREYRALKTGFKAFSVHNSLAYGKSLVCSVDNGRALMAQMLPKERQYWRCVWQETQGMSWEQYGDTFQAGVRRLLFRMEQPTRKVAHNYKYIAPAQPEMLRLGPSAGPDSSSSTNRNSLVRGSHGGSSSSTHILPHSSIRNSAKENAARTANSSSGGAAAVQVKGSLTTAAAAAVEDGRHHKVEKAIPSPTSQRRAIAVA